MHATHRIINILIFSLISLAFLPAVVVATTTPTTTSSESTSVVDPLAVQEAMSTDKVSHGRLSFDVGAGVPKRINSSPVGLTELDLPLSSVLNRGLLEIHARKFMLTQPIEELSIDDASITMVVTGQARLFGIIPIGLLHKVEAELDGRDISLSVDNTTGWSWLATKIAPDSIIKNIRQQISQANYFSSTQLKAHLLQVIVEVIAT